MRTLFSAIYTGQSAIAQRDSSFIIGAVVRWPRRCHPRASHLNISAQVHYR
jgi:hypothetical protein